MIDSGSFLASSIARAVFGHAGLFKPGDDAIARSMASLPEALHGVGSDSSSYRELRSLPLFLFRRRNPGLLCSRT